MQGEPRFRGFSFSGGPAGPKTPIAPEGGFGYVAGIMNKIVAIVAALAVLSGLAYWCADHHVVRTDKGVIVLAKRYLAAADSFVDVRAWSSADFDGHPDLKAALVSGGYGELLADLKARERQAALDDLKNRAAGMAKDMADQVATKAEEVAGAVSQTASEVAGQVAQKAEEVAAQVSEKIDETLAGD